ncbi:MAG: hypothetical protein E7Z84_04890 [Methanosphaera stadtmanae]|nr:hypothetical protein [Methanosphaera stadtmanae]
MTLTNEIHKQIEENHNVLLFNTDIYSFYSEYKLNQKWIFISSPSKGKRAIEIILNTIEPDYKIKNESVAKLLDEIAVVSKNDKVVIFVDNFEHINKRTAEYYDNLINMRNVILIVNINDEEIDLDMQILENFIILNQDLNFNRNSSVNIRFTILFILSVFIFLLFMRLQLSVVGYLISSLWFSYLMYRSFYYISR